ncbi:MAG: hypothetical protein JXB60_08110, partial [Candidatus Cloacimonetes bacterium]|nr:hypothetical protein [Candidatus Cloacimonadota bacterium]
EFVMPLDEIIGLASDNVYQVVHLDSLIFAATKGGISVFTELGNFPFPFLLNNYNSENGLSTNSITSLAISPQGWLFCGSDAGLDYVMIDSLNFTYAWHNLNENNSSLPSSYITSLAVSDNYLAVGTRQGLAMAPLYDLEQWTIYGEAELNGRSSVYPVYIDEENNLWFSYGYWEEGLLDVVDTTRVVLARIITSPEPLLDEWYYEDCGVETNRITGITRLADNRLCLLTWGEGFLVSEQDDWLQFKKHDIGASLVHNIEIDHEQTIWVSSGYHPPPTTPPLPRGTAGVSSLKNEVWEVLRVENSPILSNNIYSMETDASNRKWFGAWWVNTQSNQEWDDGISIYDEADNSWEYITTDNGLRNNCISFLTGDAQGNMWVSCCGGSTGGVNIIDSNDNVVHSFSYDTVDDLNDALFIFLGQMRYYFGGIRTGLRIWNNTSWPETNGSLWSQTPFNELQSGEIFAITSSINGDIEEIWVASANGLFSYRWTTYFSEFGQYLWYTWGTSIKRKAFYNGQWLGEEIAHPEFWYIEGEERLYGSVPTFPTALLVDPFNRLWIGTNDNGITMYDISRDRYTIYNAENSPLISNRITSLAYDNYSGRLYIGTDEALQSAVIGISEDYNFQQDLETVKAFPNPFYPDRGDLLRIESIDTPTMPVGDTRCYIYNMAGDLIIVLKKNILEQFDWDGLNETGSKCSSGIYFYVVSASNGQTARGKFALIR